MIKIYLRKFLTSIASTIWSELIAINLFFLNKFTKDKYFYNNSGGFGDSYTFFLETFFFINKKKKYVPLSYTNYQKSIIDFLFTRNKNILFSVPKFIPIYQTISKIKKSKFFKPYKNVSFLSAGIQDLKILNNNLTKNLLEQKLLKSKISRNLLFLEKEKFFCLHIKHYNNSANDLSGSHARQTAGLEKIFLLINFLLKNRTKILILGNKYDKFISIIKSKLFANQVSKIFFFEDLTDNYSFADQVFVTKHSIGYVGSAAGMSDLFYFLKKKSLLFDSLYVSKIHDKFNRKYRRYLYKKIKTKNKFNILTDNLLNYRKKFQVFEVPITAIENNIKKFLLKK
jgi:hypothetical protein